MLYWYESTPSVCSTDVPFNKTAHNVGSGNVAAANGHAVRCDKCKGEKENGNAKRKRTATAETKETERCNRNQ